MSLKLKFWMKLNICILNVIKYFYLEWNKKIDMQTDWIFTSISGFANKSLMISMFSFSTAICNGVLLI